MRKRIFDIVNYSGTPEGISRVYNEFVMIAAFISVVPMMFKAGELSAEGAAFVHMLDIVTVLILILDYFLRWMTHDLKRESRGRTGGIRAFIIYPFTISAIIDMLAILPTIAPVASSLIFLRLLRLVKVFRASKNLRTVGNVFMHEGRTLISVFSVVGLFIFVTGLVMFLAEPDTFETFIDALYWATAALTTIGYGDYHPTTDIGQLVNAFSAIFGIIVLAIPTGIIAAGYVAEMQRQRNLGIQSQRAIDVDRSLFERLRDFWEKVKNAFIERRNSGSSFAASLKSDPQFARYVCVMIACIIFSCTCLAVQSLTGFPYDINLFGIAVAAFFLEPAAGFFVGFANIVFGCFMAQNISYVIFLGDVCIVSFVYGVVLNRRKPLTAKRILSAIVFMVFGVIIMQLAESSIASWEGSSEIPKLFLQIADAVLPGQSFDNPTLEYVLLYLLFFLITCAIIVVFSVVVVVGPYLLYKHRHPERFERVEVDASNQAAPVDDGEVEDKP